MKNYKDYPKISLGGSDKAELTYVTFDKKDNGKHGVIYYGEDGEYSAYLVDGQCPIPDHYVLIEIGYSHLYIIDDERVTLKQDGLLFKIFRAGNFGTIIQMI